jgi:predicted DNA-binding transcriptional regulator YafY
MTEELLHLLGEYFEAVDADEHEYQRAKGLNVSPTSMFAVRAFKILSQIRSTYQEARKYQPKRLRFTYTNYKGETSERVVVPKGIRYGEYPWTGTVDWYLVAEDMEKGAERFFLLSKIKDPSYDPPLISPSTHNQNSWLEIKGK